MATVDKVKSMIVRRKRRPLGYNKRSINAENVAKKVLANVRSGKKVVLGQIAREVGYSENIAKQPSRIVKTFSYQATIAPYIEQMSLLRDKTLKALNNKDLDEAKIFDLTVLMKNVNHDLQLLQGKSTENVSHKATVVVYGSEDFLSQQMQRVNGGSA